jgi:TRAP-type C4-dicarboxylate transport system substrate-binding protein
MMFPMVGLVSARVWVRLDEADQNIVRELMTAELDQLVRKYVHEESEYLKELENTEVEILHVHPEFFGDAIEEWDALWREQSPALQDLRRVGSSLSPKAGTE